MSLEDFDAHRGSADSGQVALVDDEDVAVQSVGEQLRQLGFVTESATDVEGSLLRPDARLDDHPVGEQHSFDDSAGGCGCRRVRDGTEQRRSGLGEPQRAALWPGVRNEYGRVGHLIWPGLECGAYQRFYRDVTLAVAKPRGTLGQSVAAVDDAVDQPTAGSDVDPLQRLGARVW